MAFITTRQLNRLQTIIIEANPSQKAAQEMIENSDMLSMLFSACDLKKVDRTKLREVISILQENPYKDEKEAGKRGYPSDYHPISPRKQFRKLHKAYPELDGKYISKITENLGKLQENEELYQVIPKLSAVAKLYGIDDPFNKGYYPCLTVIFSHMESCGHQFQISNNYRRCFFDGLTRMSDETRDYLEKLEMETPGDFLVIPMQSGKLFAGYSVRNARIEIENADQWALPSWIVGYHLFTHPKRLPADGFLNINNCGDEYHTQHDDYEFYHGPDNDVKYLGSLCFYYDKGLTLFKNGICFCDGSYGSASGFKRE